MARPKAAAALLLLLHACAAAAPPAASLRRAQTSVTPRAQTPGAARAQAPATARPKGLRAVVVSERGRGARTVNLSKHVDAARIERASVLFLTRRGEFTYLLLDVCGLSKVPAGDGMCGAGAECNVVWLKLDALWRVLESKSVLYESCWAPVTSEEGARVTGRRMTLALEDLREEVRREVVYDADSPDAGLSVKESAIPKTTP